MWLLLAFGSAFLLGCYDLFKKGALQGNAVVPVLFLNTLFSSLIFLPLIAGSASGCGWIEDTLFFVPSGDWQAHGLILFKSVLVLTSWLFGYYGIKHLPVTIVGPINATRPVMVLIGAMMFFGERLNLWQWIGVLLAVFSFFLLSRSGKKEGIDFRHNRWILFVFLSTLTGALSGLYDKFLMARLAPMLVQSWFAVYQFFIMAAVLFILWWPRRREGVPLRWKWSILGVSVFLSAADFLYFWALSYDDSMISVVSMIRRSSVIVSFAGGALFFREKNLAGKAVDLALVLLGMVFLYVGSR